MSAPIAIAALRGGAHHLVDGREPEAWCDADVSKAVRFEYEPGSDFGAHKDDCPTCLRLLREAQRQGKAAP